MDSRAATGLQVLDLSRAYVVLDREGIKALVDGQRRSAPSVPWHSTSFRM